MTEEQVTKAILKWLITNSWKIICFDFPQSGTGKFIHRDDDNEQKNKETINPDIVCVKGNIALYFENKDHYYYPDYEKISELIKNNQYKKGFCKLLNGQKTNTMFYGIGIPFEKYKGSAKRNQEMTDFIVTVEEDFSCKFEFNKHNLDI